LIIIIIIIIIMRFEKDSNAPRYVLLEFHMQKLAGLKGLLVVDMDSSCEHVAWVVDVLKTNMFMFYKIFGCWVWSGLQFSTVYLMFVFSVGNGVPHLGGFP
jgi:hypothetical protein